MSRQDDMEARVSEVIARLERDFADLGDGLRWSITRALIHRGVHHASDAQGVEFCALATYLSEMIGHAHKIAHGENPKAPVHKDFVH